MAATDPSDIMRLAELAAEAGSSPSTATLRMCFDVVDLRAAHDTHTRGLQSVTIRNDGRRESEDVWVMAGDLVYSFDNIVGPDPASPQYTPIGLAQCSQANLILATDAMVKLVGGETRRVIPDHEDALAQIYPHRVTRHGLRIIELAWPRSSEPRGVRPRSLHP
jgi:N-acyl homoserine lactone hydrolase